MNVSQPIASKILKRLRARKGEVVPTREFLDLGKRPAVDQSLSRLARREVIRRLQSALTPAQKSELKDALGRVPAWMEPVIPRIVGGEHR